MKQNHDKNRQSFEPTQMERMFLTVCEKQKQINFEQKKKENDRIHN